MAFVQQYTVVTYTIEDSGKNKSTVSFKFAADAVEANIQPTAEAIRDALATLCEGVIQSYTITKQFYQDTPTVAPAGAEVQRKGILRFEMTGGAKGQVEIPAIGNSVFVTNTDVINTADANIQTLATLIIDNGALDTSPVDAAGRYFTTLIDGYKYHRRSGTTKGLRRG